jgi:hypothetical protein
VTEQLGKWAEAAKESYDREQQLHEINKELRNLDASELESPQNRRRIAQQATAENANAARLDSLTQSGRSLVQQATKNDEFDPKRLESLASMLKSVSDIAAKRMPNVADLLKQSASAPSAPSVSRDANPPDQQADPSQADGNGTPKPSAPGISDRESTLGKPEKNASANEGGAKSPAGGGRLGLPSTTLSEAPGKPGDESSKSAEPSAEDKLDSAIKEQKGLLEEFAKVSDELSQILASLEASTFVKRLKSASRHQVNIATSVSQKTLDSFGIEREPVKEAETIATRAKEESETVRIIQSDLDAYYQRKQDSIYKNVLDQMKKMEAVRALSQEGEDLAVNFTGRTVSGSEFWADTLDRWAEELVAAGKKKEKSGDDDKGEKKSPESLPPEVVLKVMQALRDEMKLRDETREAENARPAVDSEKFGKNAQMLADKQNGIKEHTEGAVRDVLALPDANENFGKELKLLQGVVSIMDEAKGILGTPDTGAKAIAAETDVIEMLLQAQRAAQSGKPGGGGSMPGEGGNGGPSSSALADLGPSGNVERPAEVRPVGQSTGRAGKEFPEEFKSGLDTYFNLLESKSSRQ